MLHKCSLFSHNLDSRLALDKFHLCFGLNLQAPHSGSGNCCGLGSSYWGAVSGHAVGGSGLSAGVGKGVGSSGGLGAGGGGGGRGGSTGSIGRGGSSGRRVIRGSALNNSSIRRDPAVCPRKNIARSLDRTLYLPAEPKLRTRA